jgi:hypothetical protein
MLAGSAALSGRAESLLRPRVWVEARLGVVGVERPV